MKKITDSMVDAAYNKLAQRVEVRAVRKLHQDLIKSGKSFEGLDNIFNDHDANFYAFSALRDELAGIPMPQPIAGGLGANFITKAVKKIRKGVNNVIKSVRSVVKKVGPAIIGAIVSFYAGPVVGKTVAAAMSKVASSYAAKRVQAMEYQKMVKAAKAKAANMPATAFDDLPLGVTQEQAQSILEGKIPPGMDEERVWHIIEQAKLIASEKISPIDAYVLHHHTYGKDAPPISYIGSPDPALESQLKPIEDQITTILKKGSTTAALALRIAESKGIPFIERYENLKRSNAAQMAAAKSSDYSDPEKRAPLQDARRLMQAFKAADPIFAQYKDMYSKVEASTKKTFPGAKYEGAGAVPVPPPAPAVVAQAATAIESPAVTQKVEAAAKEVLKEQGVDVTSQAGQEALKLQVQQLQQQVADAIKKGETVVTVPYTPSTMEPIAKVEENPDGTQTIMTKETTSNAGALLLPAIGLLLALKGG